MAWGYIYLLHYKEDIYKLGRTQHSDSKRFRAYPPGMKGYIMLGMDNYIVCEGDLIKIFKQKYVVYGGNEFFRGNVNDMTRMIWQYHEKNIFKQPIVVAKFVEHPVDEKTSTIICEHTKNIKEDVDIIQYLFNIIVDQFGCLAYCRFTLDCNSVTLKLENKYKIYSLSWLDTSNTHLIELDKFIEHLANELKICRNALEIVYLYTMADFVNRACRDINNYNVKVKSSGKPYSIITYRIYTINIDEYRHRISCCADIKTYSSYRNHWNDLLK